MLPFPSTLDVPLHQTEDGAIRVGETRVLLETVIHAFQNGDSPEVIVENYPSLQLKDVYAVTAYYLRHREEVDAYIEQVMTDANTMRARVEARQDTRTLRNRLLKQAGKQR